MIDFDFVYEMVWWCLMDSLGCGVFVFDFFVCMKMLGLFVEGICFDNGMFIFGMDYCFDFIVVVFNIGMMVCWLDFNDMWLVVEWGYFLDNFGVILVCVDYCVRYFGMLIMMCDVLMVMIKVYEI